MQRPAKPSTPVRFRLPPPTATTMPASRGFFVAVFIEPIRSFDLPPAPTRLMATAVAMTSAPPTDGKDSALQRGCIGKAERSDRSRSANEKNARQTLPARGWRRALSAGWGRRGDAGCHQAAWMRHANRQRDPTLIAQNGAGHGLRRPDVRCTATLPRVLYPLRASRRQGAAPYGCGSMPAGPSRSPRATSARSGLSANPSHSACSS